MPESVDRFGYPDAADAADAVSPRNVANQRVTNALRRTSENHSNGQAFKNCSWQKTGSDMQKHCFSALLFSKQDPPPEICKDVK